MDYGTYGLLKVFLWSRLLFWFALCLVSWLPTSVLVSSAPCSSMLSFGKATSFKGWIFWSLLGFFFDVAPLFFGGWKLILLIKLLFPLC